MQTKKPPPALPEPCPEEDVVLMGVMPPINLSATVAAVLARAPTWIRREFAVDDVSARTRAEEALAAMIADALTQSEAAGEKLPGE